MHSYIEDKKRELAAACRRHNVASLAVFGSAARGTDFSPERSDADLLVEFGPWTGHDPFLALKEEIELILGRTIDLVDRKALATSRNYITRATILAEAEPVFDS